ncbi:hypothetical protein HELRODRAFT_189289 [Helobdella robusta]|uniref:Uncharacterized protein n=1 Tax=Helobdella robusta TaxID=6412 RepID=T1FQX3_HELRO|nr:hypothetical protein HELRODRAFT_189289 [Helobdella robusta]ESN96556.1 hypothetical protein HELRODRAFT_189289 [Helobdella robusta]
MEIEQSTCHFSEVVESEENERLNNSADVQTSMNDSFTSCTGSENNDGENPSAGDHDQYNNDDGTNNVTINNNSIDEGDSKSHKKKRCRRKRKAGEHHKSYKNSWDEESDVLFDTQHTVKVYKGFNGRNQTVVQPRAPNNTNQFLMDDHCLQSTPSPFYDRAVNKDRAKLRKMSIGEDPTSNTFEEDRSLSDSDSSTTRLIGSEVDCCQEDDDGYMCTEFIKEYENYRISMLQAMNKDGLIKECLRLDVQLEDCQKTIRSLKKKYNDYNSNNVSSNNGEPHDEDGNLNVVECSSPSYHHHITTSNDDIILDSDCYYTSNCLLGLGDNNKPKEIGCCGDSDGQTTITTAVESTEITGTTAVSHASGLVDQFTDEHNLKEEHNIRSTQTTIAGATVV